MTNIFMTKSKCPKCSNFLYKGDCTVKGYHATCLSCDEDFYKFEVEE
jgi:hypothetical protein